MIGERLPVLGVFVCLCLSSVPSQAQQATGAPAASLPAPTDAPNLRERINIDADWTFALGHATDAARDFGHGTVPFFFAKAGYGDGPASPKFDDRAWQRVDVPHDWGVEVPFSQKADTNHGSRSIGPGFPENNIGWYRKSLTIPEADRGRRLAVEFDGVFRNSTVWFNGHYIGREHSGYSGFRYDLTDYVNYDGSNQLVVRVDASTFEGWFYEGAGIYRHVWLTKTDPLHVAQWGTYVTSQVNGSTATVTARATVANEGQIERRFTVDQEIISPAGKRLATTSTPVRTLATGRREEVTSTLSVPDAELWSIERPALHRLVTTVRENGAVRDRYETSFGVRTIKWDANTGFWLNGRNIKLKGTNNHQDHAGIGAALPDEMQVYRLERLKAMGANAYRASHNPPTPEMLDAADRLGMVVIDEHRMMGTTPELRDQLDRMVLRDRNHPSVVLWSIGNEEWAIEGKEVGARLTKLMQARVRELDPTRPATVAIASNDSSGNATTTEVAGLNYVAQHDADAYHRTRPDVPVVITEEGQTTATRGIYFDDRGAVHLAAYDRPPRPVETSSIQQAWRTIAQRPWMAGMFVWTGFDYRGETTPFGWPAISSQFGMLDTTGQFKDTAWYLKTQWTAEPLAHIVGHWNWAGREGQAIPIWVYANADEVDLTLNGRSLGRRALPRYGHAEWQVPYQPGVLTAVAYRGGKPLSRDRVETTGTGTRIALAVEQPAGIDREGDIAVVDVTVRDAKGRPVPIAQDDIVLGIRGDAELIGVGNGDPGSHEADRFVDGVTVAGFREWAMADVTPGTTGLPDLQSLEWRDPFRWYAPGTGPGTPDAFVLRGRVVARDGLPGDRSTLFLPILGNGQRVFVDGTEVTDRAERDGAGLRIPLAADRATPADVVLLVPGTGERALARLQDIGMQGQNVAFLQTTSPAGPWHRRLFNGHMQALVKLGPGRARAVLTATAKGLGSATVALGGGASRRSRR